MKKKQPVTCDSMDGSRFHALESKTITFLEAKGRWQLQANRAQHGKWG